MAKRAAKCPMCGSLVRVNALASGHVVCPSCHASLAVTPKSRAAVAADKLLGRRLGDFEILEILGRGGMGVVYKARQASLDRHVAIKVLPRELSQDASFATRFDREARAAAAVSHPHIISIYAVGEDRGYHYIAMELVEGDSLAQVLRRDGPLASDRALALMKQVAAALEAAHTCGVLHRDIKPGNILLTPKGDAKVADFGLAKRTAVDVSVTVTGAALGTPLYLPPEVASGQEAGTRSDLYSLGAAFYHLLAGQPPFQGSSATELAVKHTSAKAPLLSKLAPDAPPALCRVIHRLLRKSAGERYASAAELLDALGRVEARLGTATFDTTGTHAHTTVADRRQARQQRRRWGVVLGIAAIAALVVAAGLFLALRGKAKPQPATRSIPPPTTTEKAPAPEPEPPKLDPAERNAYVVLRNARILARKRDWARARQCLDRLDAKYSKTDHYAEHRAEIDALRARINAVLKPKPEPAPEPKPAPEPEAEPEPKPAPPAKPQPEPPEEANPLVNPEPEEPPEDVQWGAWADIFDGTSLRDWRVVTGGAHVGHGKVEVADGALVLEEGKLRTAVSWTQPFPRTDYEVGLEAMRVSGEREFCIIAFPVGGLECGLAIGGPHTGVAIERVEGRRKGVPLAKQGGAEAGLPPGFDSIITWQFAGPYTQDGKSKRELFDTPFPPEDAAVEDVNWQRLPVVIDKDRPWMIDFQKVPVLKGNQRVVYTRTWVFSPAKQSVHLALGSDDGIKAWLNGELVHAYNVTRGLSKLVDEVVVTLRKGCNTLKLKITQGSGGWGAAARFRALGGAPLDGLTILSSEITQGNDTAKPMAFESNRWYRVRLRVTQGLIEAWVDDEKMVEASVAAYELKRPRWAEPMVPFGLGAVATRATLRNVRMRRLHRGPDARERAEAEAEQVAALARRRQLDARYASAVTPADALTRTWAFRRAVAALGELRFDDEELAERLATRRDAVGHLARLKAAIITRVNTGKPRLRKSALLLPGVNGSLAKADVHGITVHLPNGRSEFHTWQSLPVSSARRLVQLSIDRKRADDSLAAGLLALQLTDLDSAKQDFEHARSLGAAVDRFLDGLAAAEFARAQGLLRTKRFADVAAALGYIDTKCAASGWRERNKAAFEAARSAAKAGLAEAEAEKLHAKAAALLKDNDLYALKPIVDKLQNDYGTSRAVTDPERKPSFAEMRQAIAGLGKFLTVRRYGKADFKKIQDAIDAAPTNSLIEILDNGPYDERLRIGRKGLTLRGKEECWPVLTFRGQPRSNDLLLDARCPRIVLEHLVLVPVKMLAVHAEGQEVRLRSVIIAGNCRLLGRKGGRVDIDNCIFLSREWCDTCGNATITNSIFRGSVNYKGGGKLKFQNVLCRGARAEGTYKSAEVRDCTIFGEAFFNNEPNLLADSIVCKVEARKRATQIEFCDVFGKTPYWDLAKPTKRCFSADPQFRDPRHLDYRLKPTSPCRRRASDRTDLGCCYTPDMLKMLKVAFQLRKRGRVKF